MTSILLMKLKSFKTFFGLLIIFLLTPMLNAEEKIDIWKIKVIKKRKLKKKVQKKIMQKIGNTSK